MSENKTNRSNDNYDRQARDILFDQLKETAASRGNELFKDAMNRLFDWLRDEGGPRLYKFLGENAGLFLDALFSKGSASLKATRIITEHEERQRLLDLANNVEKQNEIIDVITTRFTKDNLLYVIIDLFTRTVDCPRCGYKITENWYDHVAGESSSERNMGTEVIYSIRCDDFQCPNCKEVFIVGGFICSYPDGIYDSHQLKTSTE